MAKLRSVKDIVDAEENGAVRIYSFRKTPSQITTAGVWFDLSMSPGNPLPNYYAAAPLVSISLSQSSNGGIFHGSNVSPMNKYLRSTLLVANNSGVLPMSMILADYLMYYPFIDEGSTNAQVFTNSISLPRYPNGEGVQMMAVSVAARTGGQRFIVGYTNSNGVSGRVTPPVFQISSASNGQIISGLTATQESNTPFIPLQRGDTGVRSIESVTMLGADIGLFTLVLVKPLLSTQILELTAAVECDLALEKGYVLPEIMDNAYLSFICNPRASMTSVTLLGTITTIFN